MMPTITPFLWFDTQAEEAMTSKRVMNAMLQMDKLDLNRLEQAHNGE
jgi:predicted 3-demethylubiquinone-9 3-methyltransferase (glyoxalase superfamily)